MRDPSLTILTAAFEAARVSSAADYRGTVATPHGDRPTETFASTVSVSVSTTETSFDGPFAVYSRVPSGLKASPHGLVPTATEPTGLLVFVSIETTVPPRPVVTNTRWPSGDTTTPIGLTF